MGKTDKAIKNAYSQIILSHFFIFDRKRTGDCSFLEPQHGIFWQYTLTALGFVTVKSLQVQIHTWKAPEVWPIDWG